MCNTSQGFYGTNNSLSPEAKEVLFAFMDSLHKEGDGEYVDGEWVPFFHTQIAAALRTAALVVIPREFPHIEDFPPDDDDTWGDRILYAKKDVRNQFLKIANELESYNV